MGNVYKPVEQRSRLTVEYLEAKLLIEQRRLVQTRIAEIDRALRKLREEYPEAVHVAHRDMPFRKPPGRPKPRENAVPFSVSSVPSISGSVGPSDL